ncbi:MULTISPECIES: metalloregulator ArsR/SmtB family transcription factor [unclassified Phenylobacterium]|uniref:ArsR/SmtB family transcription factor n=1 Tax=unclassified Phenylobacterium TaxID=2640670 RepID=UPI000868999E|nr:MULTISPECIES: metalloregulator ArsR/SmtB family transcription factor [unclassified Phenylobacterium]ODT87380.1 MAG: transcriptional regulator [Phenylobacterium sp. SCN 70-31]WGU41407.1 metalloregulator ArsR/SmtB family transcription factor [Phenylobacterium sp. NIBR 498073]
METKPAVAILAALAHEGRLATFRLLVQAGSQGLAAGEVARRLDVLPNTLSASLSVLSHAGLITSRREGRSVIYSANYDAMRELLAFLMEDCCAGTPEICAPLAALASQGCKAEALRA